MNIHNQKILVIVTMLISGFFLQSFAAQAKSITGTSKIDSKSPKDGDRGLAPLPTILKYDENDYDPLEGRTYRGNLRRDGVYQEKGLTAFTGEKWKFNLGGKKSGSPVIVDNVLYITGGDYFRAINAESGKEIWKTKIGSSDSTACIVKQTAYVGSTRSLLAINIKDGSILWKTKRLRKTETSPAYAYGLVFTQAVGVNANDGKIKWAYEGNLRKPKTTNRYPSSVAISKDKIVIFSRSQISLKTGYGNFYDWESPNTPVISQNGFMFGATSGAGGGNAKAALIKHSLKTGTKVFEIEIAYDVPKSTRIICQSSPALWNNMVFVGASHNKMTSFDAVSGKEKWRFEAESVLNSAPSISAKDGTIYFGSNDGTIYALNANTGEKYWSFKTKGAISSSPTINDGVVFVSSEDGFLYAVK